MAEHARIFGASSFERLMLCPGSAVLSEGAVRTTSAYAEWGTRCHEIAACILNNEAFDCTDDEMMAVAVEYADYVRGLQGDSLWVEQRVAFGPVIGVDDPEDGFGTADAIVAKGSELIVVDLKTGRGVEVTAGREQTIDFGIGDGDPALIARRSFPNPQLALYAIGALELLDGLAGDFDTVRCVIVQPRAGGVSEYVMTVEELDLWANTVARGAVTRVKNAETAENVDGSSAVGGDAWHGRFLTPGEKQCKFCPAKATCPALRDEVASALNPNHSTASPDEFIDALSSTTPADAADEPEWIAACLSKVDLIEDWCKAVRAEAERRLLAGEEVPGFKVVQGKRGARTWIDAAEAEKLLKETFRLKVEEMYDLKLISPTSAEKLHKAGAIGPRQWTKVTALVTQSEGKPHVAPASDPRPAIEIRPVVEEFENVADDLA